MADPRRATGPEQSLIVLTGPTASGKTALALALAERFDLEIVSVDSAQVYRGMDIGTAKPDAAIRAQLPHHLIDIADPAEVYSAARFARDAAAAIGAIRARGRLPLLVGGTLLYLRALFDGLSALPPADPAVRAQLAAEAGRHGWPALHRRLSAVDPVMAARLHPNDQQRVQRALEIHALTGIAPSALQARGAEPLLAGPVRRLALVPADRARLHARIAGRFEDMLARGLVDEVAALHRRGDLHPALPSVRAVGYRQIWGYLDGACTLDAAVAAGIAATRQYAKRQLTWLRSEPRFRALDPEAPDLLARALRAIETG